MRLKETLQVATTNSRKLISNAATASFGGDAPEHRVITRRWTPAEAPALVGLTMQAIRDAEKDGRLPQPDYRTITGGQQRRAGYTIQQIELIRDIMGTRPGRKGDDPTITICINNQKGGSLKTSTSVNMADWLAMMGYKVLLVDLDPQGTASTYHGYHYGVNVTDADTPAPFFLGEETDLGYAIRDTSWPSLDIIPGGLGMQRVEAELDRLHKADRLDFPPHLMLSGGLQDIADDYDIIIIDGPPNLGEITINMICAADAIICPVPAELGDYMSTAAFFDGLSAMMQGIDLSDFEPALRVLITKYNRHPESAAHWMVKQIRDSWGALVLEHPVYTTDEAGKGQIRMRTIWQQDREQRSTTKAWNNAQTIWQPVFEEILSECVFPNWPSKQGAKR